MQPCPGPAEAGAWRQPRGTYGFGQLPALGLSCAELSMREAEGEAHKMSLNSPCTELLPFSTQKPEKSREGQWAAVLAASEMLGSPGTCTPDSEGVSGAAGREAHRPGVG